MKFGIFADSHIDYIHDGVSRVGKFYDAARENGVDFCIQLGDFCSPYENKLLDFPCFLSHESAFSFSPRNISYFLSPNPMAAINTAW